MLFHELIATAGGLEKGGCGALSVCAERCVARRDQVHKGANGLRETAASALRARDIVTGRDRLRFGGEQGSERRLATRLLGLVRQR